MKNFKSKNKNSGFTLIEMMVAIGLFTIIVVMGIQSIISVYRVHTKNEDQRTIMDSLTFAMEDMQRNLSVGTEINCNFASSPNLQDGKYVGADLGTDTNCINKLNISFLPFSATITNTNRTSYMLMGGNGACDTKSMRLYKSTDSGATYYPITDTSVCLSSTKSGFLVTGAEIGAIDNIQPRTTIRLSGYIKYHDTKTVFNLQTSVSQRLIDVE